jgi:hypothetical protein
MPVLPTLLFLLLLAQSPDTEPSTPSANPPGGELVIVSDSSCPSPEAVQKALASLRPAADWPATVVEIRAGDQSLAIDLGSSGTLQRQLAVGPDCSARATSAALVIATWMDDLPATVTGAPILRALDEPTPAPPPPPPHVPAYQEIGAALSTDLTGWAPGGKAEFIRMRAEQDLGLQASIGLAAPREVWVGNGITRWMRTTAAVALHARHTLGRPFVAADLGLAIAYTAAWGTSYAVNRSDRAVTWGPVAGARAGIPWGRLRLWTDVRVCRWFPGDSVQIDSGASTSSASAILPSWEGQWSFGISYVLP